MDGMFFFFQILIKFSLNAVVKGKIQVRQSPINKYVMYSFRNVMIYIIVHCKNILLFSPVPIVLINRNISIFFIFIYMYNN